MNLDLNLEEINIFEPFNNNTAPSPSTNEITPSMSPSISNEMSPSVSDMTPSVSNLICHLLYLISDMT